MSTEERNRSKKTIDGFVSICRSFFVDYFVPGGSFRSVHKRWLKSPPVHCQKKKSTWVMPKFSVNLIFLLSFCVHYGIYIGRDNIFNSAIIFL
jgi:uncharacterized membrane protein